VFKRLPREKRSSFFLLQPPGGTKMLKQEAQKCRMIVSAG
jgi:hypothetical protein